MKVARKKLRTRESGNNNQFSLENYNSDEFDTSGALETLKLLRAQYSSGENSPKFGRSGGTHQLIDSTNVPTVPRKIPSLDFDTTPTVVPGKLSKQQKRDLKRNAAAAAERASSHESLSPDGPIVFKVSNPVSGHTFSKEEGSSVYRRTPIMPVTMPNLKTAKRFLLPGDEHYKKVLSTCYDNFKVDLPEQYPQSFHQKFANCLDILDDANVYQFDITQPTGLGTKVAKTMVSRCLVGTSGITYKYLGLRMFSYSWDAGAIGATDAFTELGKLSHDLSERSKQILGEYSLCRVRQGLDPDTGSCEYNMTLINRCFPEGKGNPQLKEEPMFRNENCSVSWHADSSLEHYSTIAVYQYSKEPAHCKKEDLWKIAMRVKNNCEGPNASKLKTVANQNESDASTAASPAVACPLVNRSTYYMLDEFNHHHQHCVLPGKSDRISSTHRVSRLDGHTFQSIRNRCLAALQLPGIDSKNIRSLLLTSAEVEFEWIRQFYIQGQQHYNSHIWWHGPLAELFLLWQKIQDRIVLALVALQDGALMNRSADVAVSSLYSCLTKKQIAKRKGRIAQIDDECYQFMLDGLQEIHEKRCGWRAREADPLYRKQDLPHQPITPVPFPTLEKAYQAALLLPTPSEVSGAKRKVNTGLHEQVARKQWKKDSATALTDVVGSQAQPEDKSVNMTHDPADVEELSVLAVVMEAVKSWHQQFAESASASIDVSEEYAPLLVRPAKVDQPNQNIDKLKKRKKFVVISQNML